MQLSSLFPDKEQINYLANIESTLLTRKKTGKVAGLVALLSAFSQMLILLYPYLKKLLDPSYQVKIGNYLSDPMKLIPLIGLALGLIIYLLLRRTSFLIKETKEPFRYTCWVEPFNRIDETPADRFHLKAEDRFKLLHHDLTELINQRIKRFSILETPGENQDSSGAAITDARKSSHIHIYGNFAIREDKNNGEWIIHVMPYVRIGANGSPSTMAQSIRYPISNDDTPDELDTHEYNQLLERVYSRVTTEIYARIEKDIRQKIDLFPTAYLQSNALFYEAKDMANSNTINAFESAIELYEKAITKINVTLIKKLSRNFIHWPFVGRFFVRNLFQNAEIHIGHAKCLVYKNRIAGLSGKKRNPVFEIRQELKDIIQQLEMLHLKIGGNASITRYRKTNKKTFSILAYLAYPNDTWFSRMLMRPSKNLFDETRTILFNAYIVHSLTDTLQGAYLSAQNYLDEAKSIAPERTINDPLYYLAQAYIEPNIDKALLLFQQASEKDSSFQIAQYDLAFWTEMKFRVNNEINHNRARIALEEYDKVLRINPGNIAALAAQGYIYWLLRDQDKARRKFEEGCELKTMVSETFIGQLLYGRARILVEQGRINESYDLFSQAFASNPNIGAFTIGDNSWFHYSFYEFMTQGLWKRFDDYLDKYRYFVEQKVFRLSPLPVDLVNNLDEKEVTEKLTSSLRKIGFVIDAKNIEIQVAEKSKKWLIRSNNERFQTLHLTLETDDIQVAVKPEVSGKIADVVYSHVLNDFGNASINLFKRFGKRDYLLAAEKSYKMALSCFPNNTVARYNMAWVLYDLENYTESINLLNDVIKDNPRWFEACASFIEITQPKVDEEIKSKDGELLNAIENIHKVHDLIKEGSSRQALGKAARVSMPEKDQRDESVFSASKTADDLQKELDALAAKKEELEKTLEGLNLSKENLQKAIENVFIPTKLISLFEGLGLHKYDSNSIENFLTRKITWSRMDEDDVRVLKTYATSYYFYLLNLKDPGNGWAVCEKFFDHLLYYYYPEDSVINIYKKEVLNFRKAAQDELASCDRIIESSIISWLEQDPINYKNLVQAKAYLNVQQYLAYVENAYEIVRSTELLEAMLTGEYLKLRKVGKLRSSIEGNEELHNKPETKADFYFRLAGLYAVEKPGDEEIVRLYRKATENNGSNLLYWRSLGLSYFNLRDWPHLIECFHRAIDLQRKEPDVVYGLDYYYDYLAEAYFHTGRVDEFIQFFEASGDLKDQPNKQAIIYNRIGNLKYGNKEPLDAIPFYEKAIGLDPGRPVYHSNKGLMQGSAGKWDDALVSYSKSVELRRNLPNDYYGLEYYYDFLSEAYFNSGKLNQFLEMFEASGDLTNEPSKKAVIYNSIGNFLVNDNRPAEAFTYYEKATALDAARPIYIFNIGYTHSRVGNWMEATKFYDKAIQLRKTIQDDSYGLDYYYEFLAEAYFNLGKIDEFIRVFEESGDLMNDPQKKAIIYNRIGNLHSDLQQFSEAIPFYRKAIELDPVIPIYHSNTGLMYNLLNNWNEAVAYFQKAYDLRLKATADPYDFDYYRNFLEEAKANSQK